MKELTLKYDYWLDTGLEKYLLNLNGILKTKIDRTF